MPLSHVSKWDRCSCGAERWSNFSPYCESCADRARKERERRKNRKPHVRKCSCGSWFLVFGKLSPATLAKWTPRCDFCRLPKPKSPEVSWLTWAQCEMCDLWFVKRGRRRFCSDLCMRMAGGYIPLLVDIFVRDCARCSKTFVARSEGNEYCTFRCARKAGKQRRKARLRGIESEPYTLEEIADRDGWRCHLCGKKVPNRPYMARDRDPTVDHLIPTSEGGPDTKTNVRLAHNRCNWERKTGGEVQLLLVG